MVGSVLAASQAVPAGDVLAAAEEIVTAEARQAGSVTRLSLFDLPLGDGPAWSIGEQQVDTTAPGGREEQVVSVLPGWSAWFDGRPATLCRRRAGTSWAAAIHRAAVMLEAVLGAWILRPLQCRDRAGRSLVRLRLLDVGSAASAAPADDPMAPVRLGPSAGESGRLAIVTSGSLGIRAAAGGQ